MMKRFVCACVQYCWIEVAPYTSVRDSDPNMNNYILVFVWYTVR